LISNTTVSAGSIRETEQGKQLIDYGQMLEKGVKGPAAKPFTEVQYLFSTKDAPVELRKTSGTFWAQGERSSTLKTTVVYFLENLAESNMEDNIHI
jgi:hypothetical protein